MIVLIPTYIHCVVTQLRRVPINELVSKRYCTCVLCHPRESSCCLSLLHMQINTLVLYWRGKRCLWAFEKGTRPSIFFKLTPQELCRWEARYCLAGLHPVELGIAICVLPTLTDRSSMYALSTTQERSQILTRTTNLIPQSSCCLSVSSSLSKALQGGLAGLVSIPWSVVMLHSGLSNTTSSVDIALSVNTIHWTLRHTSHSWAVRYWLLSCSVSFLSCEIRCNFVHSIIHECNTYTTQSK